MDAKRWDKPVTVETEKVGMLRSIASTMEAAEFLLLHWPLDWTGPAHVRARHACIQVLGGKSPPEHAREAFINACEEAEIFIQSE